MLVQVFFFCYCFVYLREGLVAWLACDFLSSSLRLRSARTAVCFTSTLCGPFSFWSDCCSHDLVVCLVTLWRLQRKGLRGEHGKTEWEIETSQFGLKCLKHRGKSPENHLVTVPVHTYVQLQTLEQEKKPSKWPRTMTGSWHSGMEILDLTILMTKGFSYSANKGFFCLPWFYLGLWTMVVIAIAWLYNNHGLLIWILGPYIIWILGT